MITRQCAKRIQLTDTNISQILSVNGDNYHNFSGSQKKISNIRNLNIFCEGENDGVKITIKTKCSLNEQGNNSHAGNLDGGAVRIRSTKELQNDQNFANGGMKFTHDNDVLSVEAKLTGDASNGTPYLNISWTADFED